jgi:hypothetical protein
MTKIEKILWDEEYWRTGIENTIVLTEKWSLMTKTILTANTVKTDNGIHTAIITEEQLLKYLLKNKNKVITNKDRYQYRKKKQW